MGVFCQNLGITAYTLENYSNFKSNFSFSNGSILEIHDYFRTKGDASFNNLSQIINTVSNQDFAGLDNFRLRKILGKMKEMHAQLLKKNKNIRNKSSMSDFLNSPFSPAMAVENIAGLLGKIHHCHWTKKENLCWKVSFLNHHLKNFCLTGDCFFTEYVLRRGKSGSIRN